MPIKGALRHRLTALIDAERRKWAREEWHWASGLVFQLQEMDRTSGNWSGDI